jgi:hypothetical protein
MTVTHRDAGYADPSLTGRESTLTHRSTERWTAAAFIAAGVALAIWSGAHPWNQLAGAEVGRSVGWRVVHTSHFIAGLLLLFALLGLAAARRELFRSTLGAVTLLVAFTGSALFMAGGVFTAFIWPVLAHHAPHMIAADGPFFSSPDPLLVVTTLTFATGLALLAITLRRAGVISTARAVLLGAGALLLLSAPPPIGPAPWILFALSGVVTGLGLMSVGLALRRTAH